MLANLKTRIVTATIVAAAAMALGVGIAGAAINHDSAAGVAHADFHFTHYVDKSSPNFYVGPGTANPTATVAPQK